MNVPSESWEKFRRYHRRMLAIMIGVSLAVAAGLFVGIAGDRSWAGGFALGASAQALKFGILDLAVVRGIAEGDGRTAKRQVMSMFFSLALFVLAAILAIRLGFNVWALAAGIFLPRLILVADAKLRPNPFGMADSGHSRVSPEE